MSQRTPTIAPPHLNDTERKLHAQFKKLEEQFAQLKAQTRQMQKLASLGTAATMLAHEFNNLMTPVKGYAQHALDTGDAELMIKALRMTLKQLGIVSAISDRILGLAADEARSVQRVNLAEAVEDARACLVRDLSKDGITLTVNVDAALAVSADPRQLQQVFFNLLINARQAIAHRNGRITVTAERVDDESIAIYFADNGCGISQDDLERIFEPFFSTKERQPGVNGVGLGLSLCHEIVEEHRGHMSCRSELGKGTTFTVTLPSAD